MNAVEKVTQPEPILAPANAHLMHAGTEALSAFARRIDGLVEALDQLAEIGDETTRRCAERLAMQLDMLQPSITMIGQVKAGKTSLVNAMTGFPDLLPADVNPWTSVVTSLHLSPTGFQESTRARFTFFAEDEWSRLVNRGGRIGELASRAGADDELEKVRAQLNEMREKSRERLGKKFEMLLGQSHDYGFFDKPLIERYVCLGDDFELETDTTRGQGRFADITRSADLFIERPDLPMGLCIRDTPGVNDTFMMREQITIKAIRESRLCVVVLSAHQALSNVDLALIRLISNVKSREVIIFVNRIDELAKPSEQVPEIRASIRKTLADHQGPVDAEIVFGSAYWANKALAGELSGMDEASTAALLDWAEAALKTGPRAGSPEGLIWELSGMPSLMRALSARIVEGVGNEALDRTAKSALNLVQAMRASGQIDLAEAGSELHIERAALFERVARDRGAEPGGAVGQVRRAGDRVPPAPGSRASGVPGPRHRVADHPSGSPRRRGGVEIRPLGPAAAAAFGVPGVLVADAPSGAGNLRRHRRPPGRAVCRGLRDCRRGVPGRAAGRAAGAAAGADRPDHRAGSEGPVVEALVATPPRLSGLCRRIQPR